MSEEINGKINRVLETDIAKIIKIATFIFAIAGAYYLLQTQIALMKQDIDTIKNNHLVHIEKSLEQNNSDHKEIISKISDININVAELKTLLRRE